MNIIFNRQTKRWQAMESSRPHGKIVAEHSQIGNVLAQLDALEVERAIEEGLERVANEKRNT